MFSDREWNVIVYLTMDLIDQVFEYNLIDRGLKLRAVRRLKRVLGLPSTFVLLNGTHEIPLILWKLRINLHENKPPFVIKLFDYQPPPPTILHMHNNIKNKRKM